MYVKSKYCKVYECWKKEDTAKYEEACPSKIEHRSNHQDSAMKIKGETVVKMFRRSQELHNNKYMKYISDGVSKTYKIC